MPGLDVFLKMLVSFQLLSLSGLQPHPQLPPPYVLTERLLIQIFVWSKECQKRLMLC